MGRDDRSLFKGNRSQIIIRLQVRYLPKPINTSKPPSLVRRVFTLAFEGKIYNSILALVGLTYVTGPYQGLYRTTQRDCENEVGQRSCQERG